MVTISLTKNCKFCSYSPRRGNCSAYKKYMKCSKFNHLQDAAQIKKSIESDNCDSRDSDVMIVMCPMAHFL